MTTTEKFAIVPLAIVRDRQLTHRQRVVLEALISFRSARTGKVFSDLEGIAERCGLHPHAISTATNELARAGYIAIKRNRRGCNDYHFLFDFHDWQYKPAEAPEWARRDVSGSGTSQDFPESGISRILDIPESESRLPGIRDQDFPESGKPLQTTTTDPLETISPLPPDGGREAPEREDQAEAAKTLALAPETAAPKATKPKKVKRGATTPEVASRFDRFYSAYPRKVAPDKARAAFAKIAPDEALLARMIAAAEALDASYRADKQHWQAGKLDKRFLPHPASWLNAGRWDDEPDEDTRQPSAPTCAAHRPFVYEPPETQMSPEAIAAKVAAAKAAMIAAKKKVAA